ncbi:non-ribosomal peptide synthetase [Halotia branconii]|uniref:Amino acid adenylation domain-containing protein n=1 Tax=Halotia branconii CENA392 TaxID=1539056 RepID=A0AAJ6NPZ5_9CYAN|nr:non-ribosomal peptide synthetase [Halotia branconii]WGV24574.1 amino acid adenylation domain-containing protein [Halotia branconii CENA392]
MNTYTLSANNSYSLITQESPKFQNTLGELRLIIANLLKCELEEVDVQVPFLEMGADSIVLVDAIRHIENTFKIKITIRQLFEELTNLSALANYIEENVQLKPPTLPDQEISAMPINLQPLQNSQDLENKSETLVETVLRQQFELMSQQLEILRVSKLPTDLNVSPSQNQAANFVPNSVVQTTPDLKSGELNQSTVKKADSPSSFWRVEQSPAKTLTLPQQQYLNSLIARYTKRTTKSKQRSQTYRAVLADKRASIGFRPETKEIIYPIVGDRSQGSRIWDIDDNEYIDISMGFGVHLFGHNVPFITEALENQLKQGTQIGPQSKLAGEVATLICEITGMERVTFCNSGTEAAMTAMRVARAATGRAKIAIFKGAYHGHFDGTLAIPQTSEDGKLPAQPMVPGVLQNMVDDVLLLTYGAPESLDIIKAHAHELAAVLVEPVQSRKPDLQPKEFLQQLRVVTQQLDIALIFDEVITGFRVHPRGAQAWSGVDADIVTYGKLIGGGMPIGVIAGKAAYMDKIDGGFWSYGDDSYPEVETTFFAGTFSKHPLTMAATRATLLHLKAEGATLQERLNQRTSNLAATLNNYFEQANVPLRIVHFSSLFRFTLSGNSSYLYQPLEMDLLYYSLIEKGVYIWEGRTCFLSTAHTDEDVDYVIQAVKDSIRELQAAGFFSKSPKLSTAQPQTPKTSDHVKSSVSLTTQNIIEPEGKAAFKIPLSDAQKQLWFLAQMGDNGSLAYNISLNIQLRGTLDLAAIRQAVQQVVQRHEALRTTISSQGDFQEILPSLKIDVPVIDFSNVKDGQLQVNQWLQNHSQESFNLSNGPLFRVQILKLAEQLHLLVVSAHHIITDGWSISVILQEMMALYSATCQGHVCQIEAPMQFSSYLDWHHQFCATDEMKAHESYWLQKFDNPVPVLDLPTDRQRPPVKTYQAGRQQLLLDAKVSAAIKQFSKQNGCTLFMTLLSAYAVLFYRLTNQDDLTIGIAAAGRSLEGSERLVGYCSHILPIRTQIFGDATFIEHLKACKSVLLDAYEHQDYPFAKLIDKLGVNSNTGMSPLVNATFNLERPVVIPQMYGVESSLLPQSISFADYDIGLNVTEIDHELLLECDYNADLFDAATIERILRHYQTLLLAIIANPQTLLSQLSLLTARERQQILVEWNQTQTDYDQNQCVHQIFERQAQLTPHAVAVELGEQKLTYRELNHRANQLAHFLQSLGVKSEVLVGICVERSVEMLVAMLGVLKAGGAYLPLDPAYPQERLAYMLTDSQASVLLTSANLVSQLPLSVPKLVKLDTDWQVISRQPITNPDSVVVPSNLAYVIYTSGSTGKSKGVLIPHQALVNHNYAIAKNYELKASDRILQFASFSFDVAAEEIFPTWLSGATLVLRPEEIFSIADFVQFVKQQDLTVLNLPVAYWQEWVSQMPQISWAQNVRLLVVGSERVPLERFLTWQKQVGSNVSWRNAYGPTEATITATIYGSQLSANQQTAASLFIGHPIANTQIYILDQHLQPVPIGVTGEVHIGGNGLARGYLNRPELTAEKFIAHPFNDQITARLYKTGDLARYRSDGTIEFIGRIDHQVKIRGFRIELGEIEAALSQHPQVRECVVIASDDQLDHQQLQAYIVFHQQQKADSSELYRFLKQKLPEYMIPSSFFQLETIPLTPNAKIDRLALNCLGVLINNIEVNRVAPRNHIEEVLASIWAEVLNLKQVGIHDNFFELGGNSLLAMQLLNQVNEAFSIDLPLRSLFECSTIAEISELVQAYKLEHLESDAIEQILAEVDELIDTEIEQMLANF